MKSGIYPYISFYLTEYLYTWNTEDMDETPEYSQEILDAYQSSGHPHQTHGKYRMLKIVGAGILIVIFVGGGVFSILSNEKMIDLNTSQQRQYIPFSPTPPQDRSVVPASLSARCASLAGASSG